MDEHIQTHAEDGIMTIRISRPEKKNALTSSMYAAFAVALGRAAAHKDVRATLILGVPGAFSAGNDIADFLQAATSGVRSSNAVFDFLEAIITTTKPVVAGVDERSDRRRNHHAAALRLRRRLP